MGTIIDITLPIRTGQLSWPGDPPVAVTPFFRMADGDPANVSEVRLSSHTGTHVDPPAHVTLLSAGVVMSKASTCRRWPPAPTSWPACLCGWPDATGLRPGRC